MKRWVFLIIAVTVAVICVRLGVWQLNRLGERKASVQWYHAQLGEPVVTTAAHLFDDSLDYRRVVISGRFDFTREIVVVAQSYRGIPGVQLVTPLLLDSSHAVLVERGWAPSPDGRTIAYETFVEAEVSNVEGVVVQIPATELPARDDWPRYVRTPSPQGLAPSYPYRLAPYVLRRTTLPGHAPDELRALPPPELGNGPHLSYAVQWFSFAVVAVVGAVIFVWKQDAKTQSREDLAR